MTPPLTRPAAQPRAGCRRRRPLAAGRGARIADPRAQLGAAARRARSAGCVIAYLGSLALLFVSAFWTARPVQRRHRHRADARELPGARSTTTIYRTVAIRTVGFAALVTITDILLAFPIAYFMARVASPRTRGLLVVSILLPLWSGYLVKVYAWRLILSEDGAPQLGPRAARAEGPGLRRRGRLARDVVPLAAVHDHPDLRRARADPRARCSRRRATSARGPATTFRRVILPLALPAVVAGSIFTFSLTLGDYITPTLVSGTPVHRQRHLLERRRGREPAAGRGVRVRAGRRS